jgi:hypothetical protein
MTHTCQFCKSKVPYSKSVSACDFYICLKCPYERVVYIYLDYFSTGTGAGFVYAGYSLVVNLNEDTYHMDFMANELFPFVLHRYRSAKDPTACNQKVMELNYAPDVTPENAPSFLERLLNLKAFS